MGIHTKSWRAVHVNRTVLKGFLPLATVAAVLLVALTTDLAKNFSTQDITALIRSYEGWAPVVVVALLIVETILAPLPGWPVVMAAGLSFGIGKGLLLSWIGAWLGAVATFALARWCLHDWVWSKLSAQHKKLVEEFSQRHAFTLLLLARLFPLTSLDILGYIAGVSRVPFRTYAAATAIGLLPGVTLYTAAGYSLSQTRDLQTGAWLLGLVLAAGYVLARYAARRWIPLWTNERTSADTEHTAGRSGGGAASSRPPSDRSSNT